MIRDAQQHNENATPKDFEIDVLMEALPHYFDGDGNFKMEKFQNMLQEEQVELSRDSYELNFLGKSYARLLASLETETVIVPNEEHNAGARNANSENVYITGDNLDALKHLAKSYRGKVKCIYIDPPYNTGSGEFTYNDSFDFTVEDLVEQIGVTEQEAERILDLHGKASHSAWLTFMLPRLVVAKTLLTRDGAIFASIDANEQSNLRLLMDEIFGEDNLIGQVSVPKGTTTGQDAGDMGSSIDYLLSYARNKREFVLAGLPLNEKDQARFNREDSNGRYSVLQFRKTGNNDRREDRPNLYFSLTAPDGSEVFPVGPTGYDSRWRGDRSLYEKWLAEDMIVWEEKEDGWKPYVKYYLDGRTKSVSNLWEGFEWENEFWRGVEGNKKATHDVTSLFGEKVFQNPKPVGLIRRILEIATTPDSLVLDFFSGSATTAHAAILHNAETGSNLRFILVQISEQIDPESNSASRNAYQMGFRTIDELGCKRIELAADKIKQDTGANIDYGFKHYTLETPPQSVIDSLEDFTPDDNLFSDDPLEALDFDGTTAKNVLLTTWIVQDGYGLNLEIEKVTLQNYELTVVGNTAYAIDGGMSSDDIRVLTQKLEDGEIDITNFVYFHTAIGFEHLRELDSALRHLRNRSSVTITARW